MRTAKGAVEVEHGQSRVDGACNFCSRSMIERTNTPLLIMRGRLKAASMRICIPCAVDLAECLVDAALSEPSEHKKEN